MTDMHCALLHDISRYSVAFTMTMMMIN